MAHVYFLTRNPPPHHKFTDKVKIVEKRIELAKLSENWIRTKQQRDEDIAEIIHKLNNDNYPLEISKRNCKTLCLPVKPRAFRWSVINQVHEAIMYIGWEKTLDKVYDHYWFEGMAKYVQKVVESCITCSFKIENQKLSYTPWHTVPYLYTKRGKLYYVIKFLYISIWRAEPSCGGSWKKFHGY